MRRRRRRRRRPGRPAAAATAAAGRGHEPPGREPGALCCSIAARAIPEADAGSRAAVWGESQGGHAALWTGQIWGRYAPDLQLVGIASIVPPTDLRRNFQESSDPRVRALLTAYTATSWSRYYGAPMATFGSRSVQNVMTRLADNNCVQFNAKPRLGTIVGVAIVQRAIRNLDVGAQQPWGRLMRQNSPSPAALRLASQRLQQTPGQRSCRVRLSSILVLSGPDGLHGQSPQTRCRQRSAA